VTHGSTQITEPPDGIDWPLQAFQQLRNANIRQVAYVPDAGHGRLIQLAEADAEMDATVLTTEEEGIGYLAGAWLGGQRGALLMQSSGVGNCINTLSLNQTCRFPMVMLITMRGEWGEFNPWQIPMGSATRQSLELMGAIVHRADRPDEVAQMVGAAADLAFNGERAVAVLLSQRLIGRKDWSK
jgi:sulfopyruvate decarboxylase alpha subunit